MTITVSFVTVADSISKLSIDGVPIRDIDKIPASKVGLLCPLMYPRPDNFITGVTFERVTLGAEMADTSTKSLTMSASHSVTVDMIIKIESEIFNIDTVATNTVTMNYRGDNGSTAATHANGTTVYAWMTMEDVRKATLDITAHAYKRRFGESQSETARITAAGILLSPNDVPSSAKSLIASLRRIT